MATWFMLFTPGIRLLCATPVAIADPINKPVRKMNAVRMRTPLPLRDDLEVLVVFVADVLEQLRVWLQGELLRNRPRLRVRLRIVDRHFEVHLADIFADEAFGHTQGSSRGTAGVVQPDVVVEAR